MSRQQYYKQVRQQLYEQDRECFWCGRKLCLDHNQPNFATIEHIVKKANGGSSNIRNLTLACMPCNSSHINEKILNNADLLQGQLKDFSGARRNSNNAVRIQNQTLNV
jgi:5-methylcytosine-specific restriction endonuclease McrA